MIANHPDQTTKKRIFLTLGWQVTPGGDPRYWVTSENPKPGDQPDTELVRVPALTLAAHTAIIAQSGSGKSTFLGRLVEELLVETPARCLILDPNADFRMAHEVAAASLWEEAKYDPLKRSGKLPTEASREVFKEKWSRVQARIMIGDRSFNSGSSYEQFRLWWPGISAEFLTEDVNPMLRSDPYHLHSFVKAIGALALMKSRQQQVEIDPIDAAEKIYRESRDGGIEIRDAVRNMFNFKELVKVDLSGTPFASLQGDAIFLGVSGSDKMVNMQEFRRSTLLLDWTIQAMKAIGYVSDDVVRFYFGKAREYQAAGIVKADPGGEILPRERFQVLDLPSFGNKSTRLLAMDTILTGVRERARREWEEALERPAEEDDRIPTFIVVDEAHNVIPVEPRGRAEAAVKEHFRTIAAEGRKHGLFLILVSQRPDKLDPLVLSECGNKALLRLNSQSALTVTCQMLGLEDVRPRLLEKCLEFGIGRVLIIGGWAPEGPQLLYYGARRTVEGGRDLPEKWAMESDTPAEEV